MIRLLALLFLASGARAYENDRVITHKTEPQEVYRRAASEILNTLLARGERIKIGAEKESISLEDLRQDFFQKIEYTVEPYVLLKEAVLGVFLCVDTADSRWLISAKRPGHGVVLYKFQVIEGSLLDRVILLHESLGALGWVDDTYQISLPLYLLTRPNPAVSPAILNLARAALQEAKRRSRTPAFDVEEQGECYRLGPNNRLIPRHSLRERAFSFFQAAYSALSPPASFAARGGVTGLGGGGNFGAFLLKYHLVLNAFSPEHSVYSGQLWHSILQRGILPTTFIQDNNGFVGDYNFQTGFLINTSLRYSALTNAPTFYIPKILLEKFHDPSPSAHKKFEKEILRFFLKQMLTPFSPASKPLFFRETGPPSDILN